MSFDDPNRHRHRRRTPRGARGGTHSRHRGAGGEAPLHHHGPDTSQPPPAPPRPKELSSEAQRRLQAARLWIAANRPYYSKAVFSCPVIPAAAPVRFGIDERWRIYACSEHLESLSVERAAVELIHVINHVLRDHAQRARNTGVDAATAAVWNVAADCEINDDLFFDDLLDVDSLLPGIFDLDDFLPAERYYQHLCDNATIVEVRTQCGSGSHSQRLPHELNDETAALTDVDQTLLKHAVAHAVTHHHKHHGPDSVPEGLARWAQQTLHPQINWQQQLATALRTAQHHKTGTVGIPPNRGDIVYEEALCHTHDASSTRSSGPVLCGSFGRREGRSLRSRVISGSVRAPLGTGSAKTALSGVGPRA